MNDLAFNETVAILLILGAWLFWIGRKRRMAVFGSIIRIVITTVVVCAACRFRWDMSGPEERSALRFGPDNLMLWAVIAWPVVFLMVTPLMELLMRWRR